MKFVALALALFATSPSAFAWQKILECDGGKTVIDFDGTGSAQPFQLVIRDAGVADYLLRTGAVPRQRANPQGEIILPLQTNRDSSSSRSEFIGIADAYAVDGRVFFAKPQGDTLVLESFRTSQPTGGMYVQQEKIADWTFRGCR